MLHEQHSEAACSVTSVSGIVLTTCPWEMDAPWENPLKAPLPRMGRPAPVALGAMEHEHEAYSARVFLWTWPSLFLRPVWAKAQAESPRMMRVCFILSNLIILCKMSLLYRNCY